MPSLHWRHRSTLSSSRGAPPARARRTSAQRHHRHHGIRRVELLNKQGRAASEESRTRTAAGRCCSTAAASPRVAREVALHGKESSRASLAAKLVVDEAKLGISTDEEQTPNRRSTVGPPARRSKTPRAARATRAAGADEEARARRHADHRRSTRRSARCAWRSARADRRQPAAADSARAEAAGGSPSRGEPWPRGAAGRDGGRSSAQKVARRSRGGLDKMRADRPRARTRRRAPRKPCRHRRAWKGRSRRRSGPTRFLYLNIAVDAGAARPGAPPRGPSSGAARDVGAAPPVQPLVLDVGGRWRRQFAFWPARQEAAGPRRKGNCAGAPARARRRQTSRGSRLPRDAPYLAWGVVAFVIFPLVIIFFPRAHVGPGTRSHVHTASWCQGRVAGRMTATPAHPCCRSVRARQAGNLGACTLETARQAARGGECVPERDPSSSKPRRTRLSSKLAVRPVRRASVGDREREVALRCACEGGAPAPGRRAWATLVTFHARGGVGSGSKDALGDTALAAAPSLRAFRPASLRPWPWSRAAGAGFSSGQVERISHAPARGGRLLRTLAASGAAAACPLVAGGGVVRDLGRRVVPSAAARRRQGETRLKACGGKGTRRRSISRGAAGRAVSKCSATAPEALARRDRRRSREVAPAAGRTQRVAPG